MVGRFGAFVIFGLLLVVSLSALSGPIPTVEIPKALKPWTDWVLWSHPDQACPFLYNNNSRHCVWPGRIELKLSAEGGVFSHLVSVYRKAFVPLPGDARHWPVAVKVDTGPAVVVERDGRPSVALTPGSHKIEGRFQWEQLPEALSLPQEIGLVALSLNGKSVNPLEIREGRLWLRSGRQVGKKSAPEESLKLQVLRKLVDGHPFEVITQVELQVSGSQRELLLGQPLLQGFIPLRIESKLPARLEPDGRLRVQVRPGRWQIRIFSRAREYITEIELLEQAEPWPESEVWVFAAQHHLRLVEVAGPPQIDPHLVNLPDDWKRLPTYQLAPGAVFSIQVRRRGDPEAGPEKLMLRRNIWLDFDGAGYTTQDHITGSMTQDWRLSVDPELKLGRVMLNGKPMFITRLPAEDRDGVEVRQGMLNLQAESRLPADVQDLPATGWGRDFQQVSSRLHLPPGWRLLAVTGVDNLPDSWLQRWTLFDFFLVLITTVAVGRVWGWLWALVTLVALGLTWYEPMAPRFIWLYLIAAVSLSRLLPAGRAAITVQRARYLGLIALVIILVPFMVNQARTGLHPQLERPWVSPESRSSVARDRASIMPSMAPEPALEAPGFVGEEQKPGKSRAKLISGSTQDESRQKRTQTLDQIDPTAMVQTGPGLPGWRWRQVELGWSGPVAAEQRVGLVMIGPQIHRLLKFLTIALVLLLGWRLADLGTLKGIKLPAALARFTLVLFAFPMILSSVPEAQAEYPSQQMLDQLEQRLIAPSDCLPKCAEIQRMDLSLHHAGYSARLQLHAHAETAVPLPVDTRQLMPLRVSLNKQKSYAGLLRTAAGELWAVVPAGQHVLKLRVALSAVNEAQLPLPLRPRRVTVEAVGWTVEGIRENGVADAQLHLTRIRRHAGGDEGKDKSLTPSALPPFLRVTRTLHLGIEWSIETLVQRVSPTGSPVALHLPLLPGESVVTEQLSIKDNNVLVNMAANQRQLRWQSRIEPVASLTLQAAETDQWIEVWKADIGPIWHVESDGIAPIHHQDQSRNWLPSWSPWPGEQVTFSITRPQGVQGRTVTIDQSSLAIKPGKRATDSTLSFRVRASQGGRYSLQLPPAAELQSVAIDSRSIPIRPEGDMLSLPIVPGSQTFKLVWREMHGLSRLWRTPDIRLESDSINANLSVRVGSDRWVLWVDGPQLGPAILFWSLMLVVLLVAVILGKTTSGFLPLGVLSWFLLGIGLTQVSMLLSIAVVAWFFLLHYRGQLDAGCGKTHFNLVQLAVVTLTIIFLTILFWAVQQGLLGLPSMQVVGYGSSGHQLNWYQDRVGERYPQALILSVSLLIYRILMLLWALWLAFSLLKWLSWGWQAFARGGLWRSIEFKQPGRLRKKSAPQGE